MRSKAVLVMLVLDAHSRMIVRRTLAPHLLFSPIAGGPTQQRRGHGRCEHVGTFRGMRLQSEGGIRECATIVFDR
jgi:hypothetical protein